jgi:Big-like domain-containing protein
MYKRVLAGVIFVIVMGFAVAQTTAPVLNAVTEGASTVSGTAAAGSAPISIYDISYQEKTRIGMAGAIASDGTFSSPVRPTLIKGHQIVAIDKDGNVSAAVTVAAATP